MNWWRWWLSFKENEVVVDDDADDIDYANCQCDDYDDGDDAHLDC